MKIAVGILKWSWWRGRNSLDVCLHLCWELQVKYIQHCTCTAATRGMLLKGKSVMPLLSSLPAPSPLTQADTHTSLPRPLLAALLAPPAPAPPFLALPCSLHSIHTSIAVSGALEELSVQRWLFPLPGLFSHHIPTTCFFPSLL